MRMVTEACALESGRWSSQLRLRHPVRCVCALLMVRLFVISSTVCSCMAGMLGLMGGKGQR